LQKLKKHLRMKPQRCKGQQMQQDMQTVLHGAGEKQDYAMHLKNNGGYNE